MKVEPGYIYERDDELFIVESVYEAKRGDLTPVTLVKVRCIDPVPSHVEMETFVEKWEPYDPDAP